jgi:acyl-CoA synthetase (AMP-forming)/AMP-acid ligase II/acyl carrier protein
MDSVPSGTLLHALHEHIQRRPQQTALIFLRDGENDAVSLTYAELDARAKAIAGHMLTAVPNARRALLLHPPGLEFVAALCACFYAGVTAVPCYPPSSKLSSRSGERFACLLKDAQAELVLTDSANVAKTFLSLRQASNVRLIATDKLLDSGDSIFSECKTKAGDIALLQYTSGSTGSPKGVMLPHANLMANLDSIGSSFGLSPSSTGVSWLPPYHDMGLIGCILSALVCGCPLIMLDPRHFLQKPIRWLQAIDRYRADISGGPGFAYDLCAAHIAPEQIEALDLSCWALAFCGAETVRAATLRRFSQAFAGAGFPESALFPCYGLAEVTLMATSVNRGAGARIVSFGSEALTVGRAEPSAEMSVAGSELVGCGQPGEGIALRIVDPRTRRVCPEGVIGEIWLAGDSVASGYWGQSAASREVFRNRIESEGNIEWLRTGDLGFLSDGELYVNGRSKDLVIVRGRNYYPPDLEEAVCCSHPALALNACAVFSVDGDAGEQLVVACEIRRDARQSLDAARVTRAMRMALSEFFELSAHAVLLLKPGSLPRTTSGKIIRSACREAFLNGLWRPLVSENESSAPGSESDLFQRIASVLRVPAASLDGEQSLGELGLDSLKRVELAIVLERALGCHLAPELFDADLRLADLEILLQQAAEQKNQQQSEFTGEIEAGFDAPGREVPLTPLQHAFLYSGVEQPENFVEIVYLRTPRDLDAAMLQQALQCLEARYDSLRLRFHADGLHWKQVYGAPGTGMAFERIDVAGLAASQLREQRSAMVQNLKAGFDLAEGPLLRAVLFDRGPLENGILGLGFHHLAIDVLSVSIFVTALQYAYVDALAGRIAPQIAEPLFGRWLVAMADHAQKIVPAQLAYWREVCGERQLPSQEAANDAELGKSSPRWRGLDHPGLSQAENRRFLLIYPTPSQRHDVFLAALAHAWCEVSGEDHALVLLEKLGRQAFGGVAPLKTMGWFVCRYPVRIPSQPDRNAAQRVIETQEILRKVPDQGEGYGLLARVCNDESVRQTMNKLSRPRLKLIYRGSIDDGYRADAIFPVIGSETASEAYYEAMERNGENCHIELYVTMKRGSLAWILQCAPGFCDEAKANALNDKIGAFINDCANRHEITH